MPANPIPVYYTFGNHMHWVDLQWLWGYHVLPGCIRDMLRFCQATGTKGCVNFDGVGYEKLAAEAPEALAELRDAIRSGIVEPVGCSYGQPYGLFHGGESNVRQRIYGVRTAMRVLGARPTTFWEEEFDFYPQLPQMLRSCGFEFGSLFFQWTWHTPEVPKEDAPVVEWEGIDGSRILTATRNKLNLHQWPEDFDGLLDELAGQAGTSAKAPTSLILQWLELMPSPDWMCRSEVLLPRMKELLSDPRFDVRATTLGEYLRNVQTDFLTKPMDSPLDSIESSIRTQSALSDSSLEIPVRRYSMDQVWHGMSLGKNWDAHVRKSGYVERLLTAGESLLATLSLFGRPYANWDVYPSWEFEEAWRHLLAFQHHDNHECEGLCGHVADGLYVNAFELAKQLQRGMEHLAARLDAPPHTLVAYNPLGQTATVSSRMTNQERSARLEVPTLGYRTVPVDAFVHAHRQWEVQGVLARFAQNGFEVEIDLRTGVLRQLSVPGSAHRLSERNPPFPRLNWISDGRPMSNGEVEEMQVFDDGATIELTCGPDKRVAFRYTLCQTMDAVDLLIGANLEGIAPDPGVASGVHLEFGFPLFRTEIIADQPYSMAKVEPSGKRLRKYPKGDWMTSPQWFETVEGSVTGLTFVDFVEPSGEGLMVVHGGSQQWWAGPNSARNLVNMMDPWDEGRAVASGQKSYRLIPHGPLSNAERRRLADRSITMFPGLSTDAFRTLTPLKRSEGPPLPSQFSPVHCLSSNVVASAFYRETEDYSGRDLPLYAGHGMEYPFVLRLVEFNGVNGDVELIVAGPIARAAKTNLMGEVESWIEPSELSDREQAQGPLAAAASELEPFQIRPQKLRFAVRAYEIVTLVLDIVPGRKQARDLDAKRKVWATIHRVDEPS